MPPLVEAEEGEGGMELDGEGETFVEEDLIGGGVGETEVLDVLEQHQRAGDQSASQRPGDVQIVVGELEVELPKGGEQGEGIKMSDHWRNKKKRQLSH